MKNTLTALLAAWFALWNLTAPLTVAAQGAPPTPPPAKQSTPPKQELPALRVSTHLVQVNVIVEDKKGELVTGLTKDDFTIFDDGQQQTIGLFSAESTGTLPEASQPLPPDTYSNRFEQRAGTPNTATVILFDSLNTRVRDQLWAHHEVAKFFAKVRPTDRIALYALGSELRVLQDFTSDSTALVAALAKYGVQPLAQTEASQPATFSPVIPPGTPPITDAGTSVTPLSERFSEFLSFMNQRGADFQTMNRIHATLTALEDIANHVARLPGRKNLVWVSGSFPAWLSLPALESGRLAADSRSYAAEIEEAARVLNNANMAIYPVDARGLMGATASNAMLDVERNPNMEAYTRNPYENTSGGATRTPEVGPSMTINSTQDTMRTLAERTGGHAYYNANDIQNSIRRAVDDTRATYQLAYVPTHNKWDGKFHEIKVKVKRPDVRVRHRKGYFALSDVPNDPKLREVTLQAAAWSPLESTSLTLSVRVERAQAPGAPWMLEIGLDPREVAIKPKDDGWTVALDVLISQYRDDGKDVGGESKTLNLRMNRETYDTVQKEGFYLTRHLRLSPEATRVRVIVRDAGTGWVGSVSIPVKAPAPKA